MTTVKSLSASCAKLRHFALAAITLALTLYCVGCTHRPYQHLVGNAVMVTLPPGTQIALDKRAAAALVNEWTDGKTTEQLMLCTPSYIYERDLRELELMRILNEQKLK